MIKNRLGELPKGFGLPQTKQEGCCSSYNHPEVPPWDGLRMEFIRYWSQEIKPNLPWYLWYLYPLRCILQRIASDAWDEALLRNALSKYGQTPK